ncbi:MAG: GGDEF domain-containing protein [Leptospirales bacterium]|nr:GGDEF domain-containing protein [Leptospirales bacterium]
MITYDKEIDDICLAVDNFLLNKLEISPLEENVFSPQYQALVIRVNRLQQIFQQLDNFTRALSHGNLEVNYPDRRNYLAAGLKQLHAQLKHLTWQAQCVANGDYNQFVDFMGDFSAAFNTMVEQLKEREIGMVAQRDAMKMVFDNIEPLIIVNEEDRHLALYFNHKASVRFQIRDNDLHKSAGHVPFLETVLQLDIGSNELFDDDTQHWYTVVTSNLPWLDGKNSILIYCIDITTHKKRESDLSHVANTDQLTGIFNRRAFDNAFDRMLEQSRHNNEPLSLLIIDIDHFKQINDTYGHLHGDKVLAVLAKTLLSSISRPNDMVSRYGGEEFAVLLPSTNRFGAITLAESMRISTQKLSIPYDQEPFGNTQITISIGATTCIPSKDDTPISLIHTADKALYEAKETGRNMIIHLSHNDNS